MCLFFFFHFLSPSVSSSVSTASAIGKATAGVVSGDAACAAIGAATDEVPLVGARRGWPRAPLVDPLWTLRIGRG
jgi:hypothetical protein